MPNSVMSTITGLAGLMLLLLLSVPFLVQIDTQIDTIAYVVYAIFLISLSITIGMGIMWIMVSSRGEGKIRKLKRNPKWKQNPLANQNCIQKMKPN